MHYDASTLENKLRGIYPEISKRGVSLSLRFSDEKDAWIVELSKGKHTLTTHLERKDADACLEGIECVYLGVQIGQFIRNFQTS